LHLKWILVAALLLGSAPIAARAQQAPAKPEVVLPDANKIVLLIRTAILTLNDAVQTGNFTVLRDKAAPAFQARNTAAQLGAIFQNLAGQGVDLSAVSIITPQLTQDPAIDANARLRLKGYFPGDPVRIDFDLLFESVGGRWRLFGVSVTPTTAGASGAPAAAPAPKPDAKKQKK
jgi:hypothetical protein